MRDIEAVAGYDCLLKGSKPRQVPAPHALSMFMRQMAATVTILTTEHEGKHFGITATSVASLSLDPPSLTFAVNKSASICRPLRARRLVCVNALGEVHRDLSGIFSGSKQGDERFAHGEWIENADGIRRLSGATANVYLSVYEICEHGTHILFRGDVNEVYVSDQPVPLLYLNRQFGMFNTNVRAV